MVSKVEGSEAVVGPPDLFAGMALLTISFYCQARSEERIAFRGSAGMISPIIETPGSSCVAGKSVFCTLKVEVGQTS